MNELKNISVKGVLPNAGSKKAEKDNSPVSGAAFDQLLENLKSVEDEIDAKLQNPTVQNITAVDRDVSTINNYIDRIAGIVEKISPDNQDVTKPAKYAISQYQQANDPKKT